MFGRTSKLPVTLDQQSWIDHSFLLLGNLLGAHRLLEATVMLPIPEHFPDPYDRSELALQRLFGRVAEAMQVDPAEIEVTLFYSGSDKTGDLVPFYSGSDSGAGGLYFHNPEIKPHISINENQLGNPSTLIATLAHEIGHVILLRPGLVDRDKEDMEPLNDLLTIFLGLGVFTANSAFQFQQHMDNYSQGWSAKRLGYLSEEILGYALARFAYERNEVKPGWASFLSTNVATYFKRSASYLSANQTRLFSIAGSIKT
jgi:hypothetical protein